MLQARASRPSLILSLTCENHAHLPAAIQNEIEACCTHSESSIVGVTDYVFDVWEWDQVSDLLLSLILTEISYELRFCKGGA